MAARSLGLLALFLPLAVAQAATGANTTCSWDFASQMGSGGGILMFFLGFMTGALVIGVIWLLMDQRWRSWHVWSRGASAPAPQYAPLYPAPEPAQQPGYPPPQQGYPPGYAPPGQAGAWAGAFGLGGYRTEYELIMPTY